MTISSTLNKIIYSGNGATTSFPFTFPAIAAADIFAYYTDSAGTITTLTQGSGTTQYQVSITAAVPPNPTGAGGTVTYNPSGVPIAAGTTLTILRTQPLTQTTSLANQGNLYPSVVEQALDSLLAQVQQVNELLGRSISVAVSDSTPSALPAAAARASKYLSFDSSGNPTASASSPGTTPISSTMTAFVNAASLASARTLLGLGNVAVEAIGSGLQDDGAGNLRVNLEITTADTINQTVTSAFHNTERVATGAITYALPRANTLWNGFGFKAENLQVGGDVTFSVNAADTFQNYSSGTSFIIGRGASIEIWTDASASGTWYYRLSGGKKLVGDAAYIITPGDRTVLTNTAFTASRIWTLPTAASVKAGTLIAISDQLNTVTSTNTIVITAAGADTIIAQGTGVTTLTLFTAGANASLVSDGVSKWSVVAIKQGVKVTRLITGGPLTFTATVGATRHRVRMVGPGAGGGAQATNAGANGSAATSFQVNGTGTAWTAAAGTGGPNGSATTVGGAGGTGGTDGTTGTLIYRQAGGRGSGSTTSATFVMQSGGISALGGSAPANGAAATGQTPQTNSGGGGGGGGVGPSGGGGGAGEYVEFWVTGMVTATYTIGTGGAGGSAGTNAGGAGAAGIIIIEEFFD